MPKASSQEVTAVNWAKALGVAGVALTVGVLAGCASRGGSEPSAMIGTPPTVPTGVWRGIVTGRDMVDPHGPQVYRAELTVNPDGDFVLKDSSGARAEGRARRDGDDLTLDGVFVAPPSRAGEQVSDRLSPEEPDELYGSVDTLFRGLRVRGGAALQKAL
jgi:hypothetical protein